MIFLWLLLAVVLLPFMSIFQFLVSKAWKPTVEPNDLTDPLYSLKPEDFESRPSQYNNGDGPKFWGQGYACHQTEEWWKALKSCWDFDNKVFFRPLEPETAFSGDTLSGMLLAIAVRTSQGLLTEEEKKFLGELAWKLVFKQWVPFKFEHEDKSRGYFWAPWIVSMDDYFQSGMILIWGSRYTSWWKRLLFGLVWALFFVIHLIPLMFGMYDHNIFYKKVYACWWYGMHSDALTYAAAILNKMFFAKKGLGCLDKRYGNFNADVAALSCHFLGRRARYPVTHSLIEELNEYRTKKAASNRADYYSLRELSKTVPNWWKGLIGKFTDWNGFKEVFEYMKTFKSQFNAWKPLESRWAGGKQCQDRTWERNPQEYGRPGSNLGNLDILFPLLVSDGCLDLSKGNSNNVGRK